MHNRITMKKTIFLLILGLFASRTEAQTFAEWFQQKKTQEKYLLQQIAALEVYYGYVKKGYEISKQGLKAIGDIKNVDLDLHTDYFNSLENVNPKIRDHPKIDDIIALQINIMNTYNHVCSNVNESGAFNPEEVSYINRVFTKLLDDCAGTIDELTLITTADKLEMKDGERLDRIDALYMEMQDKYSFAQSFGNEAMVLAAGRLQEQNDIQTSRTLIGIKNK